MVGATKAGGRLHSRRGGPGLVGAVLMVAVSAILSACGGGGGGSGQRGPLPTITSFSPSAGTITVGRSAQLTWVVGNATAVTIDHGVGTVTGTMVTVSPGETTTYTLTATSAGGSVTAKATVTVVPVPVAPTIDFSASPAAIGTGAAAR